jgi:hypothetical protein
LEEESEEEGGEEEPEGGSRWRTVSRGLDVGLGRVESGGEALEEGELEVEASGDCSA